MISSSLTRMMRFDMAPQGNPQHSAGDSDAATRSAIVVRWKFPSDAKVSA